MSFRGGQGGSGGPRVKKVMTQAINLIFEFLQKVKAQCHFPKTKLIFSLTQRDRVQIWLYENTSMRIEGIIIVSLSCGND
jgi:hypothetical protein